VRKGYELKRGDLPLSTKIPFRREAGERGTGLPRKKKVCPRKKKRRFAKDHHPSFFAPVEKGETSESTDHHRERNRSRISSAQRRGLPVSYYKGNWS